MQYDESGKNKHGIHDGHRDRLRNKYFEASYTLEDHEILELLLFYAIPRKNTNDIAHDLLNKFHSFKSMFKSKDSELEKYKCIREKTILFLHFFGDLCDDYRNSITHTDIDYIAYFRENCKDYTDNTCVIISTDKKSVIQFNVYDFITQKYKTSYFIIQLIKMQISNVVIGIYKKGNAVKPDMIDFGLMDKLNQIFFDCKINVIDSLIISETNSYSLIHDGAYKFKRHG